MNYNIIVAISKNNGIGYENKLPWNIKEDMLLFSKLTRGNNNNNAIIMGRKTYESLPNNFLPKRDNLVLSESLKIDEERKTGIIKSFHNINSIIEYCNNKNYNDVWIIGGQTIYDMFIKNNIVKKLFITKIDKNYLCDKYFFYNESEWNLIENKKIENSQNLDIGLFIYEK